MLSENGPCQPPRNSTAVSTLSTTMPAYSARMNSANRRPPYSVYGPNTISASATGMSNGGRWSSCSGQTGDEEHHERDPLPEQPPRVPRLDDPGQRQRAGRHRDGGAGEHERQLVGHQLRGHPDAAEQAELVRARPAAHQGAEIGRASC